jgi:hypothetical protein
VDTAQHRTGLESSAAPQWKLQKPHKMFMYLAILIVAENPYIRAQKWLDHELNDWQISIIGVGGGGDSTLWPLKRHEQTLGPPSRLSEMHHGLFAVVSRSWIKNMNT